MTSTPLPTTPGYPSARPMARLERTAYDALPADALIEFSCDGPYHNHAPMRFYVQRRGVSYDAGASCPTCDAVAPATGNVFTHLALAHLAAADS